MTVAFNKIEITRKDYVILPIMEGIMSLVLNKMGLWLERVGFMGLGSWREV